MSNTLLINSNGYVQSKNIKVFPCAYRGYYSETLDDNGNKIYQIINPESRTTSEYSFVNSYHKLSANKESYVISWTPETTEGSHNGELKFVIGGYYFEISNCALTDFIDMDTKTPKTFYIKVKTNGENPGQYLGSFNENDKWLDTNTGIIKENKLDDYYFTGLKIVSGTTSGVNVYSLTPFASQFKQWKVTTQSTEGENSLSNILTIITNLSTSEKLSIYYTDDTASTPTPFNGVLEPTVDKFKGTITFYKQVFDISAMALPVTNLLDTGSGKYSLRMLSDIEADEQKTTNTTIASGDYSVALGRRTKAEGIISTALGDRNTVTGRAALAVGSNNLAQGNNSFTIGEQNQAKGANSATFGNKAETSDDNAIAGGYNSRAQGENSLAFGENVIAKGKNAIATGYKTLTSEAWAEGENSITLGSNTKTTSTATNAIAAGNATEAAGSNSLATGNGCKATGNNSFVGGASSEAKNENSFAFGNNVKTNANNQVVFGTYNVEDDDQAFIIANGTETAKSNKFTVSYDGDIKALGDATIEGTTNLNNNLTVKGNITADKADTTSDTAANNLYLGSATGNSSGTITVYGSTANTEVFKVTNAGITTIAGSTSITEDDDYNSTNNTAAFKVTGGAHIGKKLNVADSITAKGAITVNKADTTNTLTLGSSTTASSKGAIDVYGNSTTKVFSVADTGNTSIAGTASIAGATTISDGTDYSTTTTGEGDAAVTTTEAALKVTGGVYIGKQLKVTQATTIGGNLTATSGTTSLATTTISGVTNITNTTGYSSTTTGEGTDAVTTHSAALKVNGGVHIGEKLNVAGATTIGETLTATGITTLNNNLSVAGDLVTTDTTKKIKFGNGISNSGKFVQINGTAEIANDLTLNEDLFVGGDLKLNGNSSTFELLDTNDNPTVQLTTTEAKLPGTTITGNLKVESGKLEATDTTSTHQIGSVKIKSGDITEVSSLTASGMITANIFNATYVSTSSDRRLKQNIEDYKCENSILDLPIKKYEYISDPTKTQIGCIAQDLQKICPELVSENENGYLSIQESKLVYLLLQEVKTLKEKVESLERR